MNDRAPDTHPLSAVWKLDSKTLKLQLTNNLENTCTIVQVTRRSPTYFIFAIAYCPQGKRTHSPRRERDRGCPTLNISKPRRKVTETPLNQAVSLLHCLSLFLFCSLASSTPTGEIHELKEDLNHNDPDQRKEAVKKVIAGMTVGKDVSVLFPDVIKCMQVTDTVPEPHIPPPEIVSPSAPPPTHTL